MTAAALGECSTSSLWTASDVARRLGVPTSWVYEQSRRGKIPTVRLGRYRRYRREAIEEWIEALEQPLKTRAEGALNVTGGMHLSHNGRTSPR